MSIGRMNQVSCLETGFRPASGIFVTCKINQKFGAVKYLQMIAVFILIVLPGCEKSSGASEEKFPDCVGTEESFNPYSIQKAYSGSIWNQDTSISTQFIFTEYRFNLSILRTSWIMYFKLATSPTSVSYYSASCFRSDITDNWYANSGLDFNGHYTTWDFYFEELDCSELYGFCRVIRPDKPDTLDFNIEGSR